VALFDVATNDAVEVIDPEVLVTRTSTGSLYSLTLSEEVPSSDECASDLAYARTISVDILGAVDDRLTETAYTRFADEALDLTDSFAIEVILSATDNIDVTDELSIVVVYVRAAQDTVSLVDNVTGEPDVAHEDALTITDTVVPATAYVRDVQDADVVTDQVLTEFTGVRFANDTISVTTAAVLVETVFPQETVTVTETLTAEAFYDRSLDEAALTINDGLTPETRYERSSNDSDSVTDSVTAIRLVVYDILLSDTVAVTDHATSEPTYGASASDTISVTDQVTRDGMVFSRFVDEPLTITESIDRSTAYQLSISDTAAVTDSAIADTTKERSASDAVSVTDTTSLSSVYARLPVEALDVTESVIATRSRITDIFPLDNVTITDTVLAESIDVDIDVADTLAAITDTIARETTLSRVFTDSIGTTDFIHVEHAETDRSSSDTIGLTEAWATEVSYVRPLVDGVQVVDTTTIEILTPFPIFMDVDGFGLVIGLPEEIRYDQLQAPGKIFFRPLDPRAVPFQALEVHPQITVLDTGTDGTIFDTGDLFSNLFGVGTSVFSLGEEGNYIEITNGQSPGVYRITTVLDAFTVLLDRPLQLLDAANGALGWSYTSAIQGLHVRTTNKVTSGSNYFVEIRGYLTKDGSPFRYEAPFYSYGIEGPRLDSVSLTDEGVLVVNYDQEMRSDREFVLPSEYTITGPTDVMVKKAWSLGPSSVALETLGLSSGTYLLSVNYAGTPKDVAGNPIDPVFSQAVFSGVDPLKVRSIFTDRGPIAKPPLTILEGAGASIDSITEVTLPGATLIPDYVGLYLRLGPLGLPGTSSSSVTGLSVTASDSAYIPDTLKVELVRGSSTKTVYVSPSGVFKIVGVLSTTKVRLQASFTVPDPASGALFWELFDPRNGEIADDPADVKVKINGAPVAATAVIGLLGQVVLDSAPLPDDDVKVDYSWCPNPTVEVRRLNSREFRLNSWNRDVTADANPTQHKYRYNNVLVRPSDYEALNMLAPLDQPTLRGLHYRAYERAYTPVLNDPTLLLLNSPIHRIAFPPAERTISEEFITYEATVLPDNDLDPWERHGSGLASVMAGVLTVTDNSTGIFPFGQPIFWTRSIDLTFPHAFAMSWRFHITSVPTLEGVFTGVAAGYTDETAAYVIGFLDDGGTKKVGFLKRGSADDPSLVTSWIGGIDTSGVPTEEPVELDWTILRSYRVFRDRNGTVRLFVDGNVLETLRVTPIEAPLLEELNAPFNEIQGAFFGSVSRPAKSTSLWDFVRYLILPTNPLQTSPSSFVSYEATVPPEVDPKPWTPIGFHGTETIIANEFLLLDSTSATDSSTAVEVGLMGGDFKGFVRMEPLLTSASQVVVDVSVQLRTYTHGVDPYGLMFAVDDGSRLTQVAFLAQDPTPKFSYGGRSLPEDFSPYVWTGLGTATAEMEGRTLRISDASVGDGKVYFIEDVSPPASDARVVAASIDYFLEFRAKVISYTPDVSGFAGVFAQVFDGSRTVGMMLSNVSGTKIVYFHSDGVPVAPFPFNWDDGEFHTYRFAKNTTGNLVSLFIDGVFIGTENYSTFSPSAPDNGMVSFGSSTAASSAALSVVDWSYCNAWRTRADLKHYVGIWKGYDADELTGYHLPLKTSGKNAQVVGNALGDDQADFFGLGVVAGDQLIVDFGPNKGVYEIAGVSSATSLTIVGTWPLNPTLTDYRIVRETDWVTQHKYRLTRDTTGEVSLLFETDVVPLIRIGYNSIDLPSSGTGIVKVLTNGLAAIAFGSFSPENLEQSNWDYVRYGITRSPTEQRIAPHHQFINQWNVMESPERLFTALPHELTSFKSSSTGIVPKKDPDFLRDPGLPAFTQLNADTPLVPSTQTFEVRSPYPVQEFVSVLNRPEDVLNTDGDFTLNDGTFRFRLVVPDDVLYSSIDVIEQLTGDAAQITPFSDVYGPQYGAFKYTKEVCLTYDANSNVLPENDATSPTPWTRESDVPTDVMAAVFGGVLTYRTVGSKTVYKNNTPLPDAPGLQTEAKFRLRVANDATLGTGDTQVRLGLSAPGLTVALAFVTTPLAERYVLVVDLNNGAYLGSVSFDFLDGSFHDYKIVRDPGAGVVRVSIDS
jgi:hypothetical protein